MHSRDTQRRRRRGFSILEVVVALFFVIALGTVATVKAGGAITQSKVQRAAQRLQTDVQQAFAIAARNRKAVILRWQSSSVEMQVTDRTQTTIYRRTPLGVQSGMGLAASDVTVYPTVLTVFPNGLAADTLSIRLSKNGYTKVVRVSRAGMVRLQ